MLLAVPVLKAGLRLVVLFGCGVLGLGFLPFFSSSTITLAMQCAIQHVLYNMCIFMYIYIHVTAG